MNKDPKERSLRNEKEQAEDFLETLYIFQKKGRPLTRKELCEELNMSRPEYKRLFRMLQEQECLKPGDGELLVPTEYGNVRAMEILERHRYLTDFIQMICKVEKESAEENACRMEHVISEDVFCGITDYMRSLRSGSRGQRIIRGWDVNRLYNPGSYEFQMGIYNPEKRKPRLVSRENELFCREIRMEVEQRGIFLLRPRLPEDLERYQVWYLREKEWVPARRLGQAFSLPSDIFTYTICERMPVTEGDAFIAVISDKAYPQEMDARELNVHLW